MIVDLCKPINKGESRTIRIVMTVGEAREALACLTVDLPPGVTGEREHSLLEAIRAALRRNDAGFEGKEEFP